MSACCFFRISSRLLKAEAFYESDGAHEPTRKGVVVGCGEPPAGSSVTALRSRASPGSTERVTVARPCGSVSTAGTLLPWFTLFAGLQGYAGVTGLYGRLLLGGGVLAAAGGVGPLFTHRPALTWVPGAIGLVLLGFSIWLLSGLLDLHRQLLENPMLVARLGPGLFVSLGGAVVLAATLLPAYTLRSAGPPPQDA